MVFGVAFVAIKRKMIQIKGQISFMNECDKLSICMAFEHIDKDNYLLLINHKVCRNLSLTLKIINLRNLSFLSFRRCALMSVAICGCFLASNFTNSFLLVIFYIFNLPYFKLKSNPFRPFVFSHLPQFYDISQFCLSLRNAYPSSPPFLMSDMSQGYVNGRWSF